MFPVDDCSNKTNSEAFINLQKWEIATFFTPDVTLDEDDTKDQRSPRSVPDPVAGADAVPAETGYPLAWSSVDQGFAGRASFCRPSTPPRRSRPPASYGDVDACGGISIKAGGATISSLLSLIKGML
ncbi:uncharacterized protein E0L32_011339 [Thyridium curvatum]|uniref:Uncharacterized protein n=1 Tax=Thyridium curvatum TaxID=1093900 RepID=A0A507BHR7_9PEZI|nr:uncharacterized protein E0L32_011339 [Thyridium curvatum]TPX18946.1 hypothetical protein E0L32_011339 [Thyridium curvatum]